MKICPYCKAENDDPDSNFCGECGKQITIKKCPKCDKELHNPKKFCTNCGHKLRFCPDCGSEYLEDESYCGECGYKLSHTPKKTGETKPVSAEIPDDTPIISEKRVSAETPDDTSTVYQKIPNRLDIPPQPPQILPAVKTQIENRARQTENSLQMLSWNSPPLNFKKDFLNNLDNGISYSRTRRLKELRANFLNFINRPEPNYTRSLEELHKIIDGIPDNTEVSLNIAFCYQKMGNMNKVFETLIKARNVKPDSLVVLQNLLGVSCLLRFWETFLDTLKSYYKIAKDSDPDSHLLFDFELRFGFYEDALQTLKDLLTLSDYTIPQTLPDYLTLMAVRCLDDKTNSVFFKKINDYHPDINTLISLLELKVKNKETPEYRAGKIGDNEALHAIKQKDIETKSLRLYDLRQKYLQEKNGIPKAKGVCEKIAQLRQEQRTKESYLYEGYLIEIKRLINAGGLDSIKKAEELCWSIPFKEHPEEWEEVNNKLLSEKKRYSRYSENFRKKTEAKVSRNISFSKKKRPVDIVMRDADKLAQKDPNSAISFLIEHENEFIDLADKIRKNNLLGHSCVRMRKFKKAMECYKFVLDNATQKQQKVGALLALALIYRKMSDYRSAIDSLNKIVSIDNSRKAHITTLLAKIKEIKEAQLNDKIEEASNLLDDELLNTSRLFSLGAPLDEVSNFLDIEIKNARVEGLRQETIENKDFSLKDIDYLHGKAAEFVRTNKPKPAAVHYLSAVKVLYALGHENDHRVSDSLRNFCSAKGRAYIIENPNWDVARTYFIEFFHFSVNFDFPQLENFDPNEVRKSQSEINLSQFLSTYHRSKDAFLGKADWPINNLLDILRDRNEKVIFGALRGLILLASYNTEVGRYILFMANYEAEILDKLCHYFAKMYSKAIDKADYNFLEEMIDFGISQIRYSTQILISEFQFYETNIFSFGQFLEKTAKFLGWNPPFKELGVDFIGTDTRYLDKMKSILLLINTYDSSANFDDRVSKYLTVANFMDSLIDDINKSPTYWGRTYMQPLVKKWKNLLDTDYRKQDEGALPNLLIETIERAVFDSETGIADIHVVVSNRKGNRSASGVKLHILPSFEESYFPLEDICEIGPIQIEKTASKTIQIRVNTNDERLTLNYQISYDKKDGAVKEEPKTISITLIKEPFEAFENPYTTWSNASVVTDKNMFKGRKIFVEKIVETLTKVGRNKNIVIYGQKRSGKSSILYHVAQRFKNEPDSNFLPIFMDLGEFAIEKRILDAPVFFQAILLEFQDTLYPIQIPEVPSIGALSENTLKKFASYLKRLYGLPEMENRNPLLIIDEFTYLYSMIKKGNIDENFMQAWKSVIEKHLFSILLAGTDDMPNFMKENANPFASTMPEYVGYLDEIGARELIVDPIRDIKENVSRIRETAVKKMFQLTAGNPFYIQILMDKLVIYMNRESISRAIVADVDKVVEDYIGGMPLTEATVLFDNLVSFLSDENEQTKLEKRTLQVIAHLTINYEFANKQSILQEFGINEHEDVEKIINHLLVRNVLEAQPKVQAYRIQVELFNLWLNEKMPYERRSSLVNPYIIGDPVTGNNFYGRQQQVDQILQNISHKSYLLDAEWRTGKTSLLYKIQHELRLTTSDVYYFIPVFISIDERPENEIWHRIGEGFADAINNHASFQFDASESLSLGNPSEYKLRQLKNGVLEIVSKISTQNMVTGKKLKFVVEIDEGQQINNYTEQTRADLRNFLSQDLKIKPHLNSIIAGYKIDTLAGMSSSPWTNFMVQIHLEGLSDDDFRSLIIGPIKKQYDDRYQFDTSAVEKISEYSQRIPYDTQVYCNLAFDEITASGVSVITGEIVERIKSKACSQIANATCGVRGDDNA